MNTSAGLTVSACATRKSVVGSSRPETLSSTLPSSASARGAQWFRFLGIPTPNARRVPSIIRLENAFFESRNEKLSRLLRLVKRPRLASSRGELAFVDPVSNFCVG
jgi:hypothetical protein